MEIELNVHNNIQILLYLQFILLCYFLAIESFNNYRKTKVSLYKIVDSLNNMEKQRCHTQDPRR